MEFVLLLAFVVSVAILFVFCARRAAEARAGFSRQPCISDQEYCALMPDVPDEVALRVRAVLVDATGWDSDEIHPDTKLVEFELW